MRQFESVGEDALTGRRLLMLEVETPEEVAAGVAKSPHGYPALVVWNARHVEPAMIGAVVESLLKSGCTFLGAWGDDCGRVHDIADEVLVEREVYRGIPSDVMTTFHPNESLNDALWFVLNLSAPMADDADNYKETVVVSIGASPGTNAALRRALVDTAEFNRTVVGEEVGGTPAR